MRRLRSVGVVVLPALAACLTSRPSPFPGGAVTTILPAGVPRHLFAESAAPAGGVAAADTVRTCRNPLFDPTDNAPLALVGSGTIAGELEGDYAVPEGRYGLARGSRLRVRCRTGEVVGIVTG
jgi:hypothetical protein